MLTNHMNVWSFLASVANTFTRQCRVYVLRHDDVFFFFSLFYGGLQTTKWYITATNRYEIGIYMKINILCHFSC